jgi:demethylmenaquinone methyltransferase/2-methoxy-6-polyprenyl-1,4-benzoquinol methylase
VREYYDRRAPEYDTWYLGTGTYSDRDRPGWFEDLAAILAAIESCRPARTLDVACGTGFLTRHLPGEIVGLDQSESMLEIARGHVPRATFVRSDALALPFLDDSFERVFSGHFYGHLEEPDRSKFLVEARRVARELVVVDSAVRDGVSAEEWQDRLVADGSRFTIYKRYFTGDRLAAELGGGRVLHESPWFVAVAA